MGVTVGGHDLEDTVAELEDGDIESTAAKVIDGDLHILVLLVQTVCKCRCGRLVDDTLHVQSSDLAGFLGSLALAVGEVCRNGDDGFGDLLAEIVLSGLLHLLEDGCGDLLGRVEPSVDVHARGVVVAADHLVRHAGDFLAYLVVSLAHEPLDGEYGLVGVGDSLALGRGSDLALAIVRECHYGRSGTCTFIVDDDGRLVAFHHGHTGVCGTEVNSYDFSHCYCVLFVVQLSVRTVADGNGYIKSFATGIFVTFCQDG